MAFYTKLIFLIMLFIKVLCESVDVTTKHDNMVTQTTLDTLVTGTVTSVTKAVAKSNTQSVTKAGAENVMATKTMTKTTDTLQTGTRSADDDTQQLFTETALRSTGSQTGNQTFGTSPNLHPMASNTTEGTSTPSELVQFLSFIKTTTSNTMYYVDPDLQTMEHYVKTDETILSYLAGFPKEYQRHVVETQLKICPYVYLCGVTLNVLTTQRSCCDQCSCDLSSCISLRTCCPSLLNQSFLGFSNAKLNGIANALTGVLINEGAQIQQCISKHLTIRTSGNQQGFYAIASCPINVSPELRTNCTRPYSRNTELKALLPVFSNTFLKVFRNQYCAKCNGIKDTLFFQPTFSCSREQTSVLDFDSVKDIVKLVFATEECDMTFTNVDTRIKFHYCKFSISMCNVTGLWKIYEPEVEHACLVYRSLFHHENYTFQNVFCALCNGITPHTVTCDGDDDHPVDTDNFAFSGLMKLDHDQAFDATKIVGDDVTQCSQNQIFDSLMEECKDLYCSQLRMLQGGTCVNIYEFIHDRISYNFYIRLLPFSEVSVINMFEMEQNLHDSLLELIGALPSHLSTCDFVLTFTSEKKYRTGNSKQLQNSVVSYADARIGLEKSSRQKPWIITTEIKSLHGTILTIKDNFNVTIKFLLHLRDSDDRMFKLVDSLAESSTLFYSANLTERVSTMCEYSLPSISGLTLIPSSIMLYIRYFCFAMKEDKPIDVLRFSSCPKVNVSRHNYPWKYRDDGITVGDIDIKSFEYFHIDQDHIMVCVDLFKKILSSLRPDRKFGVEVIVSVTSSVLSLVALFVKILVYCILTELRKTTPGKNSTALAISLFMAQIMLLAGSLNPFKQYSTECKVIGLLIHFSWLCSVFWMNVCTYHIFCILSSTKLVSHDTGWKKCMYYNTYVLIMAIVFVATNVIISTSVSGQIGYGGKFCYITSRDRILFTFLLPTLLVICINLLMFLIVIIRINRSSNIQSNVKNERNELVILAKLSTITGITWVFGFLYTSTSIVAFSFIFIILNASQGVFIMFAFVANRRVLSLCKKIAKNKSKTPASTPGSNKPSISITKP